MAASRARLRTNNGDIAAAFQNRLVGLRKTQGKRQEIAHLWGMAPVGIYATETRVRNALQTLAKHAERLGIVITYQISLPRESPGGRPRETPFE